MLDERLVPKLRKVFDLADDLERTMALSLQREIMREVSLDDPMTGEIVDRALSDARIRRSRMSPPGKLGLAPLLESRRWKYGITDGAFRFQPFHDRVLVHQTQQWEGATATPGGLVVLTGIGKAREEESNPEGIVVSCGLKALDELRANGIDLGHKVSFIRQAPWRKRVDSVEGHEFYCLIFRSGDLIGSEDLATALRDGSIHVGFDRDAYQHFYIDSQGETWRPARVEPYSPEDY
jgi:co-chaperonin GroES (HSP10)